ncbi:MAG: FHA domain-containing protein [Muribaculaceae bacterium]|nr:FHA domain-containing protein [Muribaculaceae bacterium]
MEEIIIGRQGNQKTLISDSTVSRKHCRLIPKGDGTYTLENLSSLGTKVDGLDVIQTTVTLDSLIQLGPNYKAKLRDILTIPGSQPAPTATVQKSNEKQETKKFRTSHLKRLREDFEAHNLEVANTQHKINLTRTGFGIFTMCAMPTIFFLGPVGYILTGIGVIGNIYSFIGMRSVDTPITRKLRQDEFEEKWVCPNPDCGHTLMARDYKALYRDYIRPGNPCPFCKCKYIE